MRIAFTCLLMLTLPLCKADWSPPSQPDPKAILNEVETDTSGGKYADALAKLVWFRNHALEIIPALYGVRNSYALQDWKELGDVYPPALEKLKESRDEAVARVKAGGDCARACFNDVAAINRVLGEDAGTSELFAWLDQNRPAEAGDVYELAQRSLVLAHSFSLCGKYLQPEAAMAHIIAQYRQSLAYEAKSGDSSGFAARFFANRAETVVSLLVQNGKSEFAGQLATEAIKERPDDQFRAEMKSALRGRVPDPWPH